MGYCEVVVEDCIAKIYSKVILAFGNRVAMSIWADSIPFSAVE
jgi:hypothetical protein